MGKIYKFVKGAKIFSSTGRTLNATKKILWTAGKEITKEAAIDMSAQFVVNFVSSAIANPDANAWDIVNKAFSDIKYGSALWSGLINYTSLSKGEQNSFDCAYEMLKSFEENKDAIISTIQGARDCAIVFGTHYLLKYLRGTDAAKELAKAIADTKQYDIVMQKLSTIMNTDQLESFIQSLIENGIKKGVEPLWAK